MRKLFLAVVVLLIITGRAAAQDLALYEKHVYISKGDTLPYRLLLPAGYDPSRKYPLLVFLHGAGERGNDNEKQLVHGAKLFLREDVRKDYPAIIVFPQCAQSSFWSNVDIQTGQDGKRVFVFNPGGEPTPPMRLAQELLRSIIKNYPVNKKQVYIAGLSMGGMGTFEMVRRNPKLFAAAIPICGGGATASAKKMKRPKWWVFHGGKDNVVPPAYSEEMVKALRAAGADVKFTLYPDADHNSWDPAFAEPELLSWLFSQHK